MQITKKSEPLFPSLIGKVVSHLFCEDYVGAYQTILLLVLSWVCCGRASEASRLLLENIKFWEPLAGAVVLDWYQPKKSRFRYGILFAPFEGGDYPTAMLDPFRALSDWTFVGGFYMLLMIIRQIFIKSFLPSIKSVRGSQPMSLCRR
jgi:hypothetical protein